ncbi:uncharacterized protein Cadr_000028319 [Camelus dromedarius]|uniref:Uncharacterized protein n=1 Tax=Camelus dromedarius TaxID=9838 RepID=A0A5N4CAA2_CAMDR|nr:uncharacterized protein Cadr_000028319 [Camelus dromedarius]
MLFIPFTGVSTEESLVRSNPAMFITVMFGAGCWELVNPCCSLVTLTAHLRRRGQVPPDVTIALLAEDGHLVSLGEGLEEETSLTPFVGSLLLQERGTYVLVQVISKWGLRLPAVAMLESSGFRVRGGGGDHQASQEISLHPSAEGEGAAPTRYESMLENLDDWYPELAEELRWLSGLPSVGDGWRRRAGTRRGHQEQGPPSRQRVGSLLSRTRQLGQEPVPATRVQPDIMVWLVVKE